MCIKCVLSPFWHKSIPERSHVRVFGDASNVCDTSSGFLWESGQSFSRLLLLLLLLLLCMCFVTFWCKTIPEGKYVRVFCDVSRLLCNQQIAEGIKSIIFSSNFANVNNFVDIQNVGMLVLCMRFQTWTGRRSLRCRSVNRNETLSAVMVGHTNMETASQTSGTSQKTPTRRSPWDGSQTKCQNMEQDRK